MPIPARHTVLTFIAAVGLLAGSGALAATSTATPDQDAFVIASNPSGNYGAAGALAISGASTTKGVFTSVIRFDLAAIKASFDTAYGADLWTVQDITLQLTTVNPNNPLFNSQSTGQFSVTWMENDTWIEGTGTPASPTNAGGGITYTLLPTYLGPNDQSLGFFTFDDTTALLTKSYSLTLSSGILADIAAGGKASLELAAVSSDMSYLSNSRTGPSPPVLTVTAVAVPEPSAWGLAIAGCALLALLRQRHPRQTLTGHSTVPENAHFTL